MRTSAWARGRVPSCAGRARGSVPWIIVIPHAPRPADAACWRAGARFCNPLRRWQAACRLARRLPRPPGQASRRPTRSRRPPSPRASACWPSPVGLTPGLKKTELNRVPRYKEFGYGEWSFASGLPVMQRFDLMPAGYTKPTGEAAARLMRFFAFSDVHITDKEAPNQLIVFQQDEPAAAANTSIYSPVMLYSTQVLDAAIQTVND